MVLAITQSNIYNVVNAYTNPVTTNDTIAYYGHISTWDTSGVRDISSLFLGKTDFNIDISGWDVRNVTNMSGLFQSDASFNQNINSWDISNVTNMSYMFYGASSYNKPFDAMKRPNKVTTMRGMFRSAIKFNQDVSEWKTSKVTNMAEMFYIARAFNQNISSWDISNVTTMSAMFLQAVLYNQPITSLHARNNVRDMNSMFAYATGLVRDISQWNTSKVTNMAYMFSNNSTFNQNISSWDLSSVLLINHMFQFATNYNQPFDAMKRPNKVTTMQGMFQNATKFDQDVSGWYTNNVTTIANMFTFATSFNRNIIRWNVSKVTDMSGMFLGATLFNQDIGGWDVSAANGKMDSMFKSTPNFKQDLSPWNVIRTPLEPNSFSDGSPNFIKPIWESWPNYKASMFSIIPSNGGMSPDFSSNIFSYILTDNVLPFTLIPYAIPGCTVTINGSPVTSRTPSIPLNSRDTLTIRVTARNDISYNTYNFAHFPYISIKPTASTSIIYPATIGSVALNPGQALTVSGGTVVNGTFRIPPTIYSYVPNAGTYTDISAIFVPEDTKYLSATTFVQSIIVLPATPYISVKPTATVFYPETLSQVVFSGGICLDVSGGTTELEGVYTIHPDLSNSIYLVDDHQDVSAVFTPTSSVHPNYGPVSTTISKLTVSKVRRIFP